MLIHLDETLHHQASRPFRMVGISDHRFFDRYWFEALDPAGEVAVIAGLAFYKNMGTCDGFVSVQRHHRQHNLRLARPLAGDIDRTRLGPLEVTVLEPFRHLRLRLGSNDSGIALDLEWRSELPSVRRSPPPRRRGRSGHPGLDPLRPGRPLGWLGGARRRTVRG